jgi:nicotinate-nucleotide adenylyltransferase
MHEIAPSAVQVVALGAGKAFKKIGIFGGAFDPPHLAHAGLIEAAIAQLELDALYVIPTGHAWHKPRPLTAAVHRLAMAQLAFGNLPNPTFGGLPKVLVDQREIHRPGPTYTIDTLRELQAEQPGAKLVLLMGADQAAALHTWHEAEAIVQIATICVADRASNAIATGNLNAEFLHLELPFKPISATQIRHLVRQHVRGGMGLNHMVAPGVARYIAKHHLYQGVE